MVNIVLLVVVVLAMVMMVVMVRSMMGMFRMMLPRLFVTGLHIFHSNTSHESNECRSEQEAPHGLNGLQ
jgi:H+/Cl- antiporter ClcA